MKLNMRIVVEVKFPERLPGAGTHAYGCEWKKLVVLSSDKQVACDFSKRHKLNLSN